MPSVGEIDQEAIDKLDGLLDALDITDQEASRALGVHHTSMFRWRGARTPIPLHVIRFFELMLMLKTLHTTMEGWWRK